MPATLLLAFALSSIQFHLSYNRSEVDEVSVYDDRTDAHQQGVVAPAVIVPVHFASICVETRSQQVQNTAGDLISVPWPETDGIFTDQYGLDWHPVLLTVKGIEFGSQINFALPQMAVPAGQGLFREVFKLREYVTQDWISGEMPNYGYRIKRTGWQDFLVDQRLIWFLPEAGEETEPGGF